MHTDDVLSLLESARDNLFGAADDLFCAADLESDRIAEYHGERGLGVPNHGPRSFVARAYDLSRIIGELAEKADALLTEMER